MTSTRVSVFGFQVIFALMMTRPLCGADLSPEALIKADHWKRARAALEAQSAATSNNARTLYLLAEIREAFGDLDGALQLAQKSAALDGRSADTHVLLADIQGQIMEKVSRFRAMMMLGTFKKELNTALALDPNHVEAKMEWIGFHLNAPGLVGGDKKKASELADEIRRINPERGYRAKASIAEAEKNAAAAEDNLVKAENSNPSSYGADMALANFYASQPPKRPLAEKYARNALHLDPGRVGAYVTLARILAQQKRWQELEAVLREAEKKVSDDLTPYYQAGRVLYSEGSDFKRAENYFRKYLTQEPEAERPSPARAHWQLGLVLERENRKPEAVAELQTAVRMDSNFEPAKKDLKRLQ
ncbi:MAG: tetratricopeptide repeat protein [Acidobacteriia bacterium]|nr:tetratricopeptide repeat protein [Terriglobia bacterium]